MSDTESRYCPTIHLARVSVSYLSLARLRLVMPPALYWMLKALLLSVWPTASAGNMARPMIPMIALRLIGICFFAGLLC